MHTDELFSRCLELVTSEPSEPTVRYLHETLVLACAEALKDSGQGYGNVFAQVDYLCKRCGMPMRERMAVQTMRRHSNGGEELSADTWRQDIRALAVFISTVYAVAIPHELLTRLPTADVTPTELPRINQRYVRCIVTSQDEHNVYASTSHDDICIIGLDADDRRLLHTGVQLNLLDNHVSADGQQVQPGLVVVEPDFLIDISAIAACFTDYGHHPLAYTFNRLKPRVSTQPILLGNFAGAALDDVINVADSQTTTMLSHSFRQQALQFCTCEGFDDSQFHADARQQVEHIRQAVQVLFDGDHDRQKALLEPSFVCEQLGLQGRVDLMTTDMRLLVEQKSGKNWNIERPQPGQKGLQKEDHYVQLLLYYGVLRHNFHLSADRVDARLLYSKYPAQQGLLVVNFYQTLFREAIRLRNRIVTAELMMARQGFRSIMPWLRADLLLENKQKQTFFDRYIRPQAAAVSTALAALSAAERDYVERMMTFVYREQMAQKIGVQEGQGSAAANLWQMPLSEKRDTGNIFTDLRLVKKEMSADYSGYDLLTLHVPSQGSDFLPNFRRGDGVYLYAYDREPDARQSILYRGVLTSVSDDEVVVRLNDGQQNPHVFQSERWAVEHDISDANTSSAIRSLYAFCTASPQKRQLLLGSREPQCDDSRQLSRSYSPHYDEVLLRARRSLDYFLLIGPPGTGKTSMALRFLVEEELVATPAASILLMAYTNRAVDEICAMLDEAAIDYLRIGSEASADPRFHAHLLDNRLGERPQLATVKEQIAQAQVVVGTTSMLMLRSQLLTLKSFTLAVVDEASQILEPNIIGLLASDRIRRFILIGDHKQLPAVVQQQDDKPRLSTCRQSLFERLIRQEQQAGRTQFTGILRRQGRMHPDIAAFPNEMFYAKERLEPVPCPHQLAPTLPYDTPPADALDRLLQERRMLFLPSEPCRSITVSDKVNASEARIVADLLRRIHRFYGPSRFDAARTVGVIVPYRNQIAMIRRELRKLGIPALLDISIDTVERYQGSQREVIIYSFTIQQPYQLNFLTSNCFEENGRTIDRKLNVAITRARQQMLMTGNVSILNQNPLFAELIRRYSVEMPVC